MPDAPSPLTALLKEAYDERNEARAERDAARAELAAVDRAVMRISEPDCAHEDRGCGCVEGPFTLLERIAVLQKFAAVLHSMCEDSPGRLLALSNLAQDAIRARRTAKETKRCPK